MRPHVRILLDYRAALRHRTGVGQFADRLATALLSRLRADDRLTIFSSSWTDRLPETAVPGASRIDARVPVRALNFAWHRLGWPPVERLAGPVDVTHSLHPLLMPSRGAGVVTIHDLYFLDHPGDTRAEIRRDYPALAQRHAARADAVVVPSEYTAGEVQKRLGVAREKITICSPGAPPWAPRLEPAAGGPILYLGTVEPRKNVGALVHAYERLRAGRPDLPRLVLAGKGDFHPAAGVAQVTGYVSEERKMELLREASMLVVPSFDEGFGLPALEAMTLGVPVIASNRGSLPEVLGDAGLLVDPGDEASLADAMARVLDEPERRARMRTAGIERSRAFSWDASAARVYAAYERAVERRRTRS
jgi:glycosyltransferase involved in cell wall biosynthesis